MDKTTGYVLVQLEIVGGFVYLQCSCTCGVQSMYEYQSALGGCLLIAYNFPRVMPGQHISITGGCGLSTRGSFLRFCIEWAQREWKRRINEGRRVRSCNGLFQASKLTYGMGLNLCVLELMSTKPLSPGKDVCAW